MSDLGPASAPASFDSRLHPEPSPQALHVGPMRIVFPKLAWVWGTAVASSSLPRNHPPMTCPPPADSTHTHLTLASVAQFQPKAPGSFPNGSHWGLVPAGQFHLPLHTHCRAHCDGGACLPTSLVLSQAGSHRVVSKVGLFPREPFLFLF